MRKILQKLLFVLIILGGLYFLFRRRSQLGSLLQLDVGEAIILLFLSVLGFLILGLAFKSLVRMFSIQLSFKEWFGLTSCNNMFNYYLPAKAGTAAKAVYLKKKHGLAYSHYISLIGGSFVLGLGVTSVTGLLALILSYLLTGYLALPFVWVFGLFLAAALLSGLLADIFRRLAPFRRRTKAVEILMGIKAGLRYFSENKGISFRFSVLTVVFIVLMGLRLYLCFMFMDFKVDFLHVILIRTAAEFSFLISVVPGNLGIKEGIVLVSAGLFHIPPDQAVTAAVLDRAVSMTVIFVLGFIYSKLLLKQIETGTEDSSNEVDWGVGR